MASRLCRKLSLEFAKDIYHSALAEGTACAEAGGTSTGSDWEAAALRRLEPRGGGHGRPPAPPRVRGYR